jgi:hypothetical protein
VKPVNALADKGDLVEEWGDRVFFRPVGLRICRFLLPTAVTADQVTVLTLVLGLVAGHLMFYDAWWVNALGVALFVVSDVFDSVDGQLARMRGTSTPFGRMLDGASDTLRFGNLYLTLIARLVADGFGWQGALLAVAAGISHSLQSAGVDYIRQAYLQLGAGQGSELDLPEAVAQLPRPAVWWRVIAAAGYASYVRRQARLFPVTTQLVRAAGPSPTPALRQEYRDRLSGVVPQTAWLGQNIRFLLLALMVVPGWPDAYCWATLVPLNAILVALVVTQERRSAAVLSGAPSALSRARAR